MKTIDLSNTGGKILSTRARGESVRQSLDLDQLDAQDETVDVIFPENLEVLTSSFFLGMFGPSVRACGSRDLFIGKFVFKNASHYVWEDINDGIGRALREKNEGLIR